MYASLKRWPAAVVLAFGLTVGAGGAQAVAVPGSGASCAADAKPGHPRTLPEAEIFATDNTAVITDPGDPRLNTRLNRFACDVRATIRAQGADPEASTLLDGVFWSSDLQSATYERSREFDVDDVTSAQLRDIAETVRKQYRQESVLTFEYLPADASGADALIAEVPGFDVQRLHDALLADSEARDTLYGGSVTVRGGKLVLVASRADEGVVRDFVGRLGGDWSQAEVHYGAREFVG